MTRGGLSGIATQAEAATLRLRSAAEESRSAWDDGARQNFDRSHFTPIELEARVLVSTLAEVAAQVDKAMFILDGD